MLQHQSDFTPLSRLTLAGQIVEQLRAAIHQGRYLPGDSLPSERELAELLGASRVAVREALMSLQAQGVIERSHGRAARVLPPKVASPGLAHLIALPDLPTSADVRNVKQVRLALESEAVRLAAQSDDKAGRDRLSAALQANRNAISDSASFLATDMALHGAIAALAGNELLVGLSREMLAWLARFRIDTLHLEGSDMLSYREHAEIVERILARDSEGATLAMSSHLSRSHQAYGRFQSLQPEYQSPELSVQAVEFRRNLTHLEQ